MFVTACSAFARTVSEAKTGILSRQANGGGNVSFTTNAAGELFKQPIEFVLLGGATTAKRDFWFKLTRRLYRAWACFQWYKTEPYDRLGVGLRWKVRLLKAEVIETLICDCVTWSPNKPDSENLRRILHAMLFRCLGRRKRKRDDHTVPYVEVLDEIACERIKPIVRKR